MRNLDFICESPNHPEPVILRDVQGESGSAPPTCPTCAAPCEILWSLSYAHNPSQFRACTLYADMGDGMGKRRITCTTLHQLRQVERCTHDLWRQGLADPVAIQQLSQDRGNYDVGIFDKFDDRPEPLAREGRGPHGTCYKVGSFADKDVPREVRQAYDERRMPVMHVDFGEL